ncbi:MAG: hypothetical protein FWB88_01000 [Defluviitaleaceae bacterium]|nr:hypothetical protein [Defluviitaleaceae bacterium]MCL2238374.1 hypothetical protein [Defluviitaleaceae bacterium]
MGITEGGIVFAIIIAFCGLCFWGIALWAFRRKTPMHFWAGTEVNLVEIKNVPAFNRENAIMWLVYGCAFIIPAIIGLFDMAAGAIWVGFVSVAGIVPLILNYRRIYNKYKTNAEREV